MTGEFSVTMKDQRHMITGEVATVSYFGAYFTVRSYIWTADGWELRSIVKMDAEDLNQVIHKLVDLRNSSPATENLKVVLE